MTRPSLDEQGCERIHDAALRLLGDVGCVVLDPEALELLKAHGAVVEGECVRFGEELVAKALATVPAGYTVAGRRPDLDLRVALDAPPVLASASGPPFVLDGGEQRPGTLADLRTAIALAHLSPNISVLGYSVEPTDVPEDRRARVSAHAHVTGSDKANRFTVTTLPELQIATDVLEIVYGAEWHEQPRLWSIINSTSPLQFSAEGAQVLLRLARLGQPVCVAVCAMGGTTAPLTSGRPPRRAARRAARRPRADAAGAPRLPLHLRGHLVGLLDALRRPDDRRPGVLGAHGSDRAARPLARRARARRRLAHRRACPRRPGRHRVGAGHRDGPAHGRAVRAPRRRHPLVVQLLLPGEVRHRRRGAERPADRPGSRSSSTTNRWRWT